jgi:hypothetical protein
MLRSLRPVVEPMSCGRGFALALTNDVTPEKLRDILDQVARHTGRSADDYLPILGETLREVDGP